VSHPGASIPLVTYVCLVALAAGPARSDDAESRFQIKARKADDRVVAQLSGDRVVVTVMSPSGIGGATVTRRDERWPGAVVLRLRLSGMERLEVGNGRVLLSASVSSGEGHRTTLGLSEGDRKEVPVDRGSPYWAEVRILEAQDGPAGDIPASDRVFEVRLPRALLASDPPTITLDWIDFHR
jgi:hypothetical protein